MKEFLLKIYVLLCTVFVGVTFSSCASGGENGTDNPADIGQQVKIYLNYDLNSQGNSMYSYMDEGTRASRVSNRDVFKEFYSSMSDGELVAPTYELTFTELNGGTTYTFKGSWANHDAVTLRTGTYKVTGVSKAEGDNIQEKCSLIFNDTVTVSVNSQAVSLPASYDCFLLIFSSNNISSIKNNNGSQLEDFFTFKNYRYAFVNSNLFSESDKNNAYIIGTYNDNAVFKVSTGNLNFEKGKYYVYDSMTNSFVLPEMEEGGTGVYAVDLGLSVKWASWNVGASKVDDYGGLYGMADPTGNLTSTNSSDYFYNGESVCGTSNDIATQLWGAKWRLPTLGELKELHEKCTWKNDTINGVYGKRVIGPNGKSIFLPYAGYRKGSTIYDQGVSTEIWSGQPGTINFINSYFDMDLGISSDTWVNFDGAYRYVGQSVRPVLNE